MGKALLGIAFSFLFVSLFAPVAAFAKPIAISKLPYTITIPGQYTLSKSIVMTTDADGITINADNVTIDMAGYGITSMASATSNAGINVGDHTGVKIRNGFITGFGYYGIYGNGSQNLSVTNIDIFSNGSAGIYGYSNCNGTSITDCTIRDNGAGIGINGYANRVSGCTVNGNTAYGIANDHIYVSGNVVYNNGIGIYIGNGSARNNYVTNSPGYGISSGGANCLVEGNVCNGNSPNFDTFPAGATKGLNNPVTP